VKKILPVLLAGAMALTLTACGGPGTGPTDTTSSAPVDTTTSAPAATCPAAANGWDVCETPYAQVKQGGSFTGSYETQITQFNTNTADMNEQTIVIAESPVMPVFWSSDGAGDTTMNPDYLVSATPDTSSGKLVVDMVMNPKATWNDGTQITAADWIATINALDGKNKKFDVASSDGYDQITKVEQGADPSEVIFTFKSFYPDWIGIFQYGPMRAESCADPDTFNNGWTWPLSPGWQSGPYTITSYDATSGDVVETPTANWWGQPPKLDKITWKLIADQTAEVQAFANQEIDYLDLGLNSDGYTQAMGTPNSTVREAGGPNFRQFTFNSKAGFLTDLAVRQAIVYGLDRATIAASDMAGLPGTPAQLNNNIFLPSQDGFVDLGQATGLDYNPDMAKQTLEGDGWVMNDSTGFYEKNGKQLDVVFTTLSGVFASTNEYQLAQAMLQKVGINLINKTIDSSTEFEPTLTNKTFQMIAFTWMGTPYPLMNVSQIYGSKGGNNFTNLTIPTVDNNADALASEMDPAARLVLGQQDAQAIWEAVHTLPLYQRPELIAVRANLANVGAFGMSRQPADWTAVGYIS